MTGAARPPLAHRDRIELADLFEEVGPDAPTLCGDWTTADLAAHLVARERRPDGMPGLVFSPLSSWTEKVRQGELAKGYDHLVSQVRSGPPRWSPTSFSAVDRATNTHEFFVHLEDVRRANGRTDPRPLDAADQDELWKLLGRMARLAYRRVPCAVRLRRPDGTERVAKAGDGGVTLVGDPGELVLYSFGRRDVAKVTVEGDPADQERLAAADLSV